MPDNGMEAFRQRIGSRGWQVEMPANVCPSMEFYIWQGISDFMGVNILEGAIGEGSCNGKLDGEFGCHSKYSYVFSRDSMTVTVTADKCKG